MENKAVIVLANGFEEIEAIVAIDLVRRAKIELVTLGLGGREVVGAHDVPLRADQAFTEFRGGFEALILPGGKPGTRNLGESAELREWIRQAFGQGKLCAAICSAPTVLAKAGILKGRRATCHPSSQDLLEGALYLEEPVVRDGNLITSRGVGTAIPFALEVVRYLKGDELSAHLAKDILLSSP
jgi:4-methyl-5(b-hydroxyethyl)-thiazole monophosphate biosynthesis